MYSKQNKEEVLGFLKGGYKLNALVAQREFGHLGSTLAGIVRELRLEGWDIQTKMKRAPKSGRKYAEYTLSPEWRLISESLKREDIENGLITKRLSVRSFRVGDGVILRTGINVYLTAISCLSLAGKDDKGNTYLFSLEDITQKLNRINLEVA